MEVPHVKIRLDEHGFGEVEIDGVVLPNTTSVVVDSVAGEMTRISIDMIGRVTFEGPAGVSFSLITPSGVPS